MWGEQGQTGAFKSLYLQGKGMFMAQSPQCALPVLTPAALGSNLA